MWGLIWYGKRRDFVGVRGDYGGGGTTAAVGVAQLAHKIGVIRTFWWLSLSEETRCAGCREAEGGGIRISAAVWRVGWLR